LRISLIVAPKATATARRFIVFMAALEDERCCHVATSIPVL
jgi:hypothetical protein